MLAVGVVGFIVGAAVAGAGFDQALKDGDSAGAMMAGGGVTGVLGAVGILAGSIMLYQGGQQVEAAQGAGLSRVGPLQVAGRLRGVQVGFTF